MARSVPKFGHPVFETKNITKKEQPLEQEVTKLKRIIGDLTVKLKKTNMSHEKGEIAIRYCALSKKTLFGLMIGIIPSTSKSV